MLNIIILSITTICIGIFLQRSSHYLSFIYNNTTIQIPIFIVLIGAVVMIFIQYWLIKGMLSNWLYNRKLIRSIKYAKKSFFALIAGEAILAERFALRVDHNPPFGWMGMLLASQAAKQQLKWHDCNNYITTAEAIAQQYPEIAKDNNEAATFALIKINFYYKQKEYQKCIWELKRLHKEFPNYVPLLSKLIEIYKATNDWIELIQLLPTIKKSKLYREKGYQELELLAYTNRINQLSNAHNVELLVNFFKSLSKELRENKQLIKEYLGSLVKLECYDIAEKTIKNYINKNCKHWDRELIKLYGSIRTNDLASKIKTAENWLTLYPKDTQLLLVLGKLCIQADLLGKAKNYLEVALEIEESSEGYIELAKLAEIMGDKSKSISFYQKGTLYLNNDQKL